MSLNAVIVQRFRYICRPIGLGKRDQNKNLLVGPRKEDLTEEELRIKELEYFPLARNKTTDAIAVARKLTLMSEMNPGFFADHVLWQWVEQVCKQDSPP